MVAAGVQVDWSDMTVTSSDGRHGTVFNVDIFADPNKTMTGMHILVEWCDGSRCMYTVHRGPTIIQDGPCDKWRVH